ncbi:MAG: tRNA (adenosine(37)-N6)-dimethylallyltransferase MiaA [Candidatus Marinimicrobia bacterium]|nr:tRNA (adenosine(37)-N6)-dimethylallyltransferase MiaA [Candidatus Neomarinimicrobiota bacterium]|tara:strand:+ start:14161 stop:15099 length:939 start_codon:yes stop_codon:yes gene_type:complete
MVSNKKTKIDFLVITGPTASGKTKVATNIAYTHSGEIISADSRQIYKGMDIGTGKDLNEYTIRNKKIPYHLIDILNPNQNYSVYQFQRDFIKSYNIIKNNKNLPILCGGTGLYIESILLKYKLQNYPGPNQLLRNSLQEKTTEELMELLKKLSEKDYTNPKKTDTKNRIIRTIEINMHENKDEVDIFKDQKFDNFLVIGIKQNREENKQLIRKRLAQRIEEGLIEEVESLLKHQKINMKRLEYFGLEYKFVGLHLKNEITKDELLDKLGTAIGQFAKRQISWFRRMEKKGVEINWLEPNELDKINLLLLNAL